MILRARWRELLAAAIVLSTSVLPAGSQERMVLGPKQFENDRSGAGAVLCAWSILISTQIYTSACGLTRQPSDDAIDEAIKAIDEFIVANSSLHPTHAMIDDFKQRAAEPERATARQNPKACENEMVSHFRRMSPEQIRTLTKSLLAVPREPVMNPCL